MTSSLISSRSFRLILQLTVVFCVACIASYKFNMLILPEMVPEVDVDFSPYSVDSLPDQLAQGKDIFTQKNKLDAVTEKADQAYGMPDDQPADVDNYLADEAQNTPAYTGNDLNYEKEEWENQKPELLLFTTMYREGEKIGVLEKLFNLWRSWFPVIKPLVFTSDPEIEKDAGTYGWPFLPEKKDPDCYGPPLFSSMFIDSMATYDATFYCYANSDIVFDKGLLETIRFFEKNETLMQKPFIAVGKRIYFDFEKYGDLMNTADDVGELANKGEEIHWSSDYWVTTKQFPWWEVLPISVGRPLFCRWIIAYAIEKKLTVIDTSKTIKAVHLTTQDGNRSSWDKPGNDCNARIIMYGKPQVKQMRLGLVECAELETYFDETGEIKMRSRLPDPKECPAHYNRNLPAVWFKQWGLTPP